MHSADAHQEQQYASASAHAVHHDPSVGVASPAPSADSMGSPEGLHRAPARSPDRPSLTTPSAAARAGLHIIRTPHEAHNDPRLQQGDHRLKQAHAAGIRPGLTAGLRKARMQCRITRIKDTHITGKLALSIIALSQDTGIVERLALRRLGFTVGDIDAHWDEALRLAWAFNPNAMQSRREVWQ